MTTIKQDDTSAIRLSDGLGLSPALDYAGNPVPKTCENCDGLEDANDCEYGPYVPICTLNTKMNNLKGFPFKTEQKCFQLHWSHTVDWDEEGRKLELELIKRRLE